MPDASGSPITAVFLSPSTPHLARIGRPAASIVSAYRIFPFVWRTMKSTKPSPPSVRVKRVVFTPGHARRSPRSMARAACSEVSVPLNLSGAMRTRRGNLAGRERRRLAIIVTTRREALRAMVKFSVVFSTRQIPRGA